MAFPRFWRNDRLLERRRTSTPNDTASAATSTTIITASGTAEADSAISVPAYCVDRGADRHLGEADDAGGGARRLRPHADRAGDRAGQQQSVAEIDDELRPENDRPGPVHRQRRQRPAPAGRRALRRAMPHQIIRSMPNRVDSREAAKLPDM